MADLNALIAQGAQFRQAPDPLVQYGQMQQLEQNQQTNALNQMKMQEMQRGMETTNALNKFLPGLTESNRSQLLGYGAAGQGVYKTLAEGDKERRLAEQAQSQAAFNKSNILKNVVAQTRDAVAGIDPTDAPTYMALRESVLGQYPDLAPHLPAAWDANVKQRLIVTAASVLEGQKPRPPVILSPGQIAIPGNDPRLTGDGVTAPAAAAKPPDKIAIMTALGYPLTPGGNEAYETAIRAKSTVSAPTGTLAEMEATGIPKTQEGLALYYRLKEKAPVVAPEARTTEERNAELIALGAGPKGSPEFNAALRAEVLRMTAKPVAVAAAPAPTEAMKNADSFAIMKGARGTPAYNKEFFARMERFTAKSGGGGGGEAVPKAPSGYRVTKSGDLEAIPGGPAAGKPMTDLQKQGLKKDFAADTSKIKAAVDTADEMEKLTDDLVGNPDKKIAPHPGLSGIKGFQGLLASFPESPVTSGNAAKAEQKLETFKGKIKALGRSIASLDGKLGNMAVQEWQMVSDSVQAIKPTAGNLDEQMRDAVRQARLLAKNLRDKFDLTYEDTAPAAAPGTPAPVSVAPNIDALLNKYK